MNSLCEPLSILLVEDNKDHVNILRWMIGKVSNSVVLSCAEDGESVMETLTARATLPLPDIILLDLNLPKVSGMGEIHTP